MAAIRLSRPVRIEDGRQPPRYPFKQLLADVRGRIYRGEAYRCPCCGRGFKFLLYTPYMTAMCPYCLSMERYRLLCLFLERRMAFGSTPARLLDVAPMWCFQEFCRARSNIEYVSIDISSPLAMRHMDIRALEFRDEFFDCIVCYHVLEHIDDERRAMGELHRVLKPGGWAIIQVPIHVERTVERSELSPSEAEEILKFDDHLRAYGRDFGGRLESAGFRVEIDPFVRELSMSEIALYGLDCSEDLYISRKP